MSLNNYHVFIQRFSQFFQQEIKCEDSDLTLQTIITVMNKCGLKDLLTQPIPTGTTTLATPMTRVDQPMHKSTLKDQSPPSDISSVYSRNDARFVNPGGKINGLQLFLREKKLEFEEGGKIGPRPDFRYQWKELNSIEQAKYKERAKIISDNFSQKHI